MKGLGPCGGARPRRSCLQAGSHAIALPSSCRCCILMKECRGWDTEELGASAASVCTCCPALAAAAVCLVSPDSLAPELQPAGTEVQCPAGTVQPLTQAPAASSASFDLWLPVLTHQHCHPDLTVLSTLMPSSAHLRWAQLLAGAPERWPPQQAAAGVCQGWHKQVAGHRPGVTPDNPAVAPPASEPTTAHT